MQAAALRRLFLIDPLFLAYPADCLAPLPSPLYGVCNCGYPPGVPGQCCWLHLYTSRQKHSKSELAVNLGRVSDSHQLSGPASGSRALTLVSPVDTGWNGTGQGVRTRQHGENALNWYGKGTPCRDFSTGHPAAKLWPRYLRRSAQNDRSNLRLSSTRTQHRGPTPLSAAPALVTD